jgi:hypothetical protein
MPDYAQRRKIEHQVAKAAHEHLIIFTDPGNTTQIWQWVKREPGKPTACREHTYHSSQPGDALLRKLEAIAFSLEEEDTLSLTDVTRRARAGFDVERVTKRFYDQFQKEHSAFLKFISGIPESGDREWYASVMLNRLMFVYFMQRKGFLDGDRDYLRNRLIRCRKERGQDRFYSFYRYFLLRLFHEGLGGRERNADLEKLVGQVPYLNGGIFDVHELESPDRYGKAIEIPDAAFERIFDYFDQYQWHLDERPLRADNEINPDVLGYIFEKYINQKQMGAYYTKEDITGYISRNTVLPFLLDAARAKCKIAFENANGPTVWNLLRDDPDRYIYPAVRHGISWDVYANGGKGAPLGTPRLLPADIAEGLETAKPELIERRKSWNKLAPNDYALSTEIWREVVARRKRHEEIRQTLLAGEVCDINNLITLNLDICQFAQDVVQNCEDPELLRAVWHAIERITILDPTCGSGAFLFAALNILELLYEACIERMEAFVEDLSRSGETHRPERLADFRKILKRVGAHPNRRYFIFKSIILNNLFGVDIMEEAVEICKLRLFLKLAAQVEPDVSAQNLGIEPLPDIDFNIRAGNTLVGYANYDEVKNVVASTLDLDNAMQKIAIRTADLEQTFESFRQRQIDADGSVPTEHKQELRQRLKALEEELDRHLAGEYGVKSNEKVAYSRWIKSHQPFHWFLEFHGIVSRSGFDVIVGNPPYIAVTKARRVYDVKRLKCADSTDIYAWILERAEQLLRDGGRSGMIVPLSLSFSADFDSCRRLLFESYSKNWFSSFGRIPSALFSFDVRVRNTIHLAHKSHGPRRNFTTRLHRWFEAARPVLFEQLQFAPFQPSLWRNRVPKLNAVSLAVAFEKLLDTSSPTLDVFTSRRPTRHVLNFKQTAYNWLNFCRQVPPCFDQNGRLVAQTKFGQIYFEDNETCEIAFLLANGRLMLAYWLAVADDFDVTRWNFADFPGDLRRLSDTQRRKLLALAPELARAMIQNTQFKLNAGKRVGTYNVAKCRAITDLSDNIFCEALGFEHAWEDVELYCAQTVRTDFSADEGED